MTFSARHEVYTGHPTIIDSHGQTSLLSLTKHKVSVALFENLNIPASYAFSRYDVASEGISPANATLSAVASWLGLIFLSRFTNRA
jgi:hypothetical protein